MEKNRILISAAVLVLFSLLAGGSLITGELYELWFWGIGCTHFHNYAQISGK